MWIIFIVSFYCLLFVFKVMILFLRVIIIFVCISRFRRWRRIRRRIFSCLLL